MSELKQDIRAHARAHVKELTKRTTELVGELIEKGMVGVLEECIAMHVRIQELEAELARRTQPEATKPAQDLSAAIERKLGDMVKPILVPEDFGILDPELAKRAINFANAMMHQAALASPADALSAGDRVDVITDTQRMDFQQANPHMYFNVDKRGKRWRFGHFSNYPQDCYGSAREALDAAIQAQKDGHD